MDHSVSSNEAFEVLNVAFYQFRELAQLPEKKQFFKEICNRLQLKGTILLSSEGINGSLAGLVSKVRQFQEILKASPDWSVLSFKESYSNQVPYQRMLIKLKKEIIPIGDSDIKPAQWTAPRLSPTELKAWLDEKKEFNLIDTRNGYEIEHGTFKGALDLKIRHFREISKKMSAFPEEVKARPTVMFCTGGIRCEKASVVALRSGFKDVYQLEGGILKYFEECGNSYFEGECFVFDERISVNSGLKTHIQSASVTEVETKTEENV